MSAGVSSSSLSPTIARKAHAGSALVPPITSQLEWDTTCQVVGEPGARRVELYVAVAARGVGPLVTRWAL